jgi:hypothetical protein
MANVKLLFYDANGSEHYNPSLEIFYNENNEITLRIENKSDEYYFHIMSLDKSTAIKVAKTLRTEINKIES